MKSVRRSLQTVRRGLLTIALCGGALVLVVTGQARSTLALGASEAARLQEAGRTVAHYEGGKPVHGARPIARALLSRTGFETGEPTLGLDANGSVFTVAWETSLAIDVLRSDTGGRSWNVVSPTFGDDVRRHLLTVDPYLYLDRRTKRLFTVDLTTACSYLSFSDDGGASWTTNPLACGRPVNDHQTLFAGPPVTSDPTDYANVVYYCFNDTLASSCSKSLDGGMTFALTGSPAFPHSGCGGLHGHGVVGPRGEVLLPMSRCDEPYLAISRDEGDTWKRVRIARTGSHPDPSVAVDSKGNIYYAWQSLNRQPYLSISRDGGRTWSKPIMIATTGVRAVNLLTIDVVEPGRIGFAYMGTPDVTPPWRWFGYIGMSEDVLARKPLFHTAVANPTDRPFKRGSCGPMRCGEAVLDFLDVVLDGSGMPWATFVDACIASCKLDDSQEEHEGVVAYLTDVR